MAVKEKHDYPIVLTGKHVAEIMDCSHPTASNYIKAALAELKKQGKLPLNAVSAKLLVPRDLFFEVYGI